MSSDATERDLLIEIGVEELPPLALRPLSESFAEKLTACLTDANLSFTNTEIYATPRRLALLVEELLHRQPDRVVERRGPVIAQAFDDAGNPTQAALGFAKSCGVDVSDLQRVEQSKGTFLFHRARQAGKTTATLLPTFIQQTLEVLPIPKRMRWGTGEAEFVRPVHWIVVLFGDDIVPAEIFGLHSDRITYGHRFHAPGSVEITAPRSYAKNLRESGVVIAEFSARREKIRGQVVSAARAAGGTAIIGETLLEEVTALVEWPIPIVGRFEERYLELPREVLLASMQNHQKYFAVETQDGNLLNRFITIANIDSTDPDTVRDGNERVIRPRLSDAAFFWKKDLSTTLASHSNDLDGVVFERQLGSLADKTERVIQLARHLANPCGANAEKSIRAARLSRCDLLTEMVAEFPELQGTMGAYYAAHDKEDPVVAAAIGEFYAPRFAGDYLPSTPEGRTIALADKLDTLIGIFGIGKPPSGEKDPFALRRAALGALRICIESDNRVDLYASLEHARGAYGEKIVAADVVSTVFDFMLERTRAYYADAGMRGDVIDAVLTTRPTQPTDLHARMLAIQHFVKSPNAAALAAANKRIANILRKSTATTTITFDSARATEAAERCLADALLEFESNWTAVSTESYSEYLTQLAEIRPYVDDFFDAVMVMDEDPRVRANRLALLARLHGLFMRVADISEITL